MITQVINGKCGMEEYGTKIINDLKIDTKLFKVQKGDQLKLQKNHEHVFEWTNYDLKRDLKTERENDDYDPPRVNKTSNLCHMGRTRLRKFGYL